MVGRSRVRFHVRVVWLGFWSVLFGGVVLYATSRALSVVARASPSADAAASTPTEPWLQEFLQGGLRSALHVGAVSIAVGLAFAVVGAWLLRATVRGAVQ